MKNIITAAFTILIFCDICNATNLWNTIKASTAPISEFRKLVEETSLTAFIDVDFTTVFIPTDEAVKKQFPNLASVELSTKKQLVKYHLAKLKNKDGSAVLITTSVLTDTTILQYGKDGVGIGKFVKAASVYSQIPLYLVRSQQTSGSYEYFVNNAKFVANSYDKTVPQGAYHVINEVIYPLGTHDYLLDYLNGKNEFKTFLDMINKFKAEEGKGPYQEELMNRFELGSHTSTFFVPNNMAFESIPKTVTDAVQANLTRLSEFLASHVASDQVIFSSWMAYRPEVKMDMFIKEMNSKKLNSTVYLNTANQKTFVSVGGVTAQVMKSTQSLGNGLLLEINQPLNLLYRNIRNILSSKASSFLSACDQITECKNYIDGVNGECTVFAPRAFPTSLESTLTKDMLKKVVLLHILPNRRLTMATMPASTVEYDGAMNSGKLRFNQMVTGTWIEGRLTDLVDNVYSQGFVGSKINEADVAATNGVVQVIEKHLGYPTDSIYQILRGRYSDFSKLIGYLDGGFDINFKDLNSVKQRYTLFAPTNAALTAMEANAIGKQILDNTQDRYGLLKRLTLLNTVLLTNLTLNTKYEAVTALPYHDMQSEHTKMAIFVTMNRELGRDASINIGVTNTDAIVNPSKSEFGAFNGIVYVLNSIPYSSTTKGKVCKSVLCVAVGNQVSCSIMLMVVAFGQALLRTQ